MSNYRRYQVPGGTYFFTACLDPTAGVSLVDEVDLLRQSLRLTMKRFPFEIRAGVVLPQKVHMIWTLPAGDSDYAARWRLIKSTFSRHVPAPQTVRPSLKRRREKGIWQRRYWEHLIRDQEDYDLYDHLIASAPVVAGLVRKPEDWSLSSIHLNAGAARRVRLGAPPPAARPVARTTAPVP